MKNQTVSDTDKTLQQTHLLTLLVGHSNIFTLNSMSKSWRKLANIKFKKCKHFAIL
jgi:hypothetical protein